MRYVIIIFVVLLFSSCEKENIVDGLAGFYNVSGYQLSCSFKECGDTIRKIDNIKITIYKEYGDGQHSDEKTSIAMFYNDDFYLSSHYLFKSMKDKKYFFEFVSDGAFSRALFDDNSVDIIHILNGNRILADSSVYTYLKGYKIE